jgi:magnesium-protoporphyrin O-methyltransferase
MATEAGARAKVVLGKDASRAKFYTSDLEELKGTFDTVTCVDVMIHYPTDKVCTSSGPAM